MVTYDYTRIEQNTRAFLESLQKNYSGPPIHKLSPEQARNVLSSVQAMEAGVPMRAVRYHGTIHDFVMLNPITNTPATRGAIEQASHTLKKILAG